MKNKTNAIVGHGSSPSPPPPAWNLLKNPGIRFLEETLLPEGLEKEKERKGLLKINPNEVQVSSDLG